MSDMIKQTYTLVVSITIMVVAGIVSVAWNTNHRNNLMARDIQSALDKGFNPLVIRCSYASEGDRICLVYAASRGDEKRVDVITKTK